MSQLLETATAAGLLALLIDPADTLDLIDTAGAPSLLMVDADLLDESVAAVLDELRTRASPSPSPSRSRTIPALTCWW